MARNKAEDVKNMLFAQMEALADPENKNNLDEEIRRSKAMVDIGQVLVNLAKEEIAFQKMKFQYGDDFAGQAGTFFDVKETKQIG